MYEGTARLRALEQDIRDLQARHGRLPALPVGWERLRAWAGGQLEELRAIAAGTGPRTARAALAARLFLEGKATAHRFATDPESVELFMAGMIKDIQDVETAMNSLADFLEPGLAAEIRDDMARLTAPVKALGAGKKIHHWPFGKSLAASIGEEKIYDAIAAVLNKHAHASPFFILAPREDDVLIWFLLCRALEQARALIQILEGLVEALRQKTASEA